MCACVRVIFFFGGWGWRIVVRFVCLFVCLLFVVHVVDLFIIVVILFVRLGRLPLATSSGDVLGVIIVISLFPSLNGFELR